MTVQELKDALGDLDGDVEIRLAMQPAWPFEYSINDLVLVEVKGEDVVYLSEGQQLGYLPGEVVQELGWR